MSVTRYYRVVAFGAYRVGVEITGEHPHYDYLAGWLRDEVSRRKGAGGADAEATWLAGRLDESFPNRHFFTEVQRSDRLGYARLEGLTPPATALKQ